MNLTKLRAVLRDGLLTKCFQLLIEKYITFFTSNYIILQLVLTL